MTTKMFEIIFVALFVFKSGVGAQQFLPVARTEIKKNFLRRLSDDRSEKCTKHVYPPPEECRAHPGGPSHGLRRTEDRRDVEDPPFLFCGNNLASSFATTSTQPSCYVSCGAFGPAFLGTIFPDLLSPIIPIIDDVNPPDDNLYFVHGYDGDGGFNFLTSTLPNPLCPCTVSFDFSLSYLFFGISPRTMSLQVIDSSDTVILDVPVPDASFGGGSVEKNSHVDINLIGPSFQGCTPDVRLRFAWYIPESYTGPSQFVLDNVCMTPLILNRPPSAICKDVIMPASTACNAFISVNDVDGGSNDPDGDSITTALDFTGPFSPVTPRQVTLTVSDGKETSSCTAQVTVVDKEPPVIICPSPGSPLLFNTKKDTCSADITFTATVTDNCDATRQITVSAIDQGLGPSTHKVGLDVKDSSGNSAIPCDQVVMVEDNVPPVAVCVYGSGGDIFDNIWVASGSDNCDKVQTTSLQIIDLASGHVFTGPFHLSKNTIKYVMAPGASIKEKSRSGLVNWMLTGNGDMQVLVTDGAGSTSSVTCVVDNGSSDDGSVGDGSG